MSRYLFQATYTSESWATQVTTAESVVDRITPLVKACHGSLDSIYYAFGDTDVVALVDFRSPEDAAAFSLAISAGGSVRSAKTTPLLTVEQGIAAMREANTVRKSYHPPTSVSVVEQRKPAKSR